MHFLPDGPPETEGMISMRLVVIGNSAAALAAVEAFRQIDKDSSITMISKERGPAYSRVLLPYVLRHKVKAENVFIRDETFYQSLGIELHCNDEVVEVDSERRLVRTRSGRRFPYDRLLVATGSEPLKPSFEGTEGTGVFNLWTLDDLEELIPLFDKKGSALVVGSGFVSLQAAWSALSSGLSVTLAVRSRRLMRRTVSEEGSDALKDRILQAGVDLRLNAAVKRMERSKEGRFRVYLEGESPVEVDFVIVGIGVHPNVGFLKGTDVRIDEGILVDRRMRTNVDGIYAAGDVTQGPTAFGEERVVHALWSTAVEQGRVAGCNLAGTDVLYEGSLNMNVTQMFDVTVASMGMFEEGEGIRSESLPTERGFVRIFYREDLPVGGVVVGDPEDVALLGRLRPFIRNHKPCPRNVSELRKFFAMDQVAATKRALPALPGYRVSLR